MKQLLITIAVLATLTGKAFTQTKYTLQSIKQLHQKLKGAEGKDRVNILNELGYAWYRAIDTTILKKWKDKVVIKGDSVRFYGASAYNEAKKINYKKGIATAAINLSQGLRYGWWDDDGFPKIVAKSNLDSMQMLLDQADLLINEVNDHKFRAEYYELRGDLYNKRNPSDNTTLSTNWQKAIAEYEQGNMTQEAAELSTWLSMNYIDDGYLNDALDYSLKGLELAKKWGAEISKTDTTHETREWALYLVKESLSNLAIIAKNGGDFYTAMDFLNELYEVQKKGSDPWPVSQEKADLFIKMGKVDSAQYYQKEFEKSYRNRYSIFLKARVLMMQEKYDEAIPILKSSLDSFKLKRNHPDASSAATLLGKALSLSGNHEEALVYARFGVSVANQWGRRAFLVPAYETLSLIHYKLEKYDSAYYYLSNYIKLKDSIQNAQFLWRLHKSQKDASMALLMKDNQLKAQQLTQQSTLRNILIGVLLLLLTLVAFAWRNINLRKKNEQLELKRRQTELQQQTQELEMKALKAQMNPHFIFNSLSSINWFILKHKTQEASDYLTSFSRLIRLVLTNSEKPLVSLDEELKMLRLYLDMEQLRLEHSFDYRIEMMNNIDPAEIYMPPMILQPFCENAIWHGLSHKPEKGMLTVNFELQNNTLNCTIADNGVGREMAARLNNNAAHKGSSMGIQITKSRLSLFNGANDESEYYHIEDLLNEEGAVGGTKVTLKIKSKEVA